MTKLVISPDLRALEAVIERGMKSFVEVGNALLQIREKRMYRDRGYRSFDDYCRDHWGWTKTHANRLIGSAQVVAQIEEAAPIGVIPTTESQARELARADEPEEVWAEVLQEHEPREITAAVIREHVEARRTPPPSEDPPKLAPDAQASVKKLFLLDLQEHVREALRHATPEEILAAVHEALA